MKINTKTLLAVLACALIFTFQPLAFAVELDSLIVTDQGNVGIGTTTPAAKLNVAGGTDASLVGGGFALFGNTNSSNIVIDNNEIMARNNGAASGLYL